MKLFVDDARTPPPGWQLARTVQEAIHLLDTDTFEDVSLDYVIGYDDQENFSPVAKHIVSLSQEKRPKRVYIHTSSSFGARKLEGILYGHVDKIIRL